MASLSRVLLECLVPLLAQDAPAPSSPQQPAPPWVVVDAPAFDLHDVVSDLQLVVLSNGTYVGSYQITGHYGVNQGAHVVRSRDHGATWERIAKFDDVHHVSLSVHDDVVWLSGIEGERWIPGPPIVMCLRDGAERWTGERGRLRAAHELDADTDSVLHDDRIWRSFSHSVVEPGGDMRTQVLVASAALGSNLQDAASWRWSSEVPSQGLDWTFLTVTPGGELVLAIFDLRVRALATFADITNEGWELSRRREKPTWTFPPAGWRSNLARDPASGRFYVVTGESSQASEPADRPRNALDLRSSAHFEEWDRSLLLHDAQEQPVRFGPAALLIEGDDLALLVSYEEPPRLQRPMPPFPLRIAFLRVPKFRERTADSPPLWGPTFPR